MDANRDQIARARERSGSALAWLVSPSSGATRAISSRRRDPSLVLEARSPGVFCSMSASAPSTGLSASWRTGEIFARGLVLLIHVLQLAQHAAHFRTPVAACRGRLLGLRELRLKIVPPPITKSFASADTPPCGAKYDESRGPSRALHAYWL